MIICKSSWNGAGMYQSQRLNQPDTAPGAGAREGLEVADM